MTTAWVVGVVVSGAVIGTVVVSSSVIEVAGDGGVVEARVVSPVPAVQARIGIMISVSTERLMYVSLCGRPDETDRLAHPVAPRRTVPGEHPLRRQTLEPVE